MNTSVKEFEQLPVQMQSRMRELLEAKFTIKGERNPAQLADQFIRRKKPKTRRQWQFIIFMAMQSIDRNRAKLGLPKIYFSET